MTALQPTPVIQGVSPILPVLDVPAAVDFYRHRLGFPDGWTWGEPPTHGGASWGRAEFQFSQQPELAGRAVGTSYFVHVSEVEELHDRHRAAGVEIISSLENKPWQWREYTVRDLNGYFLRFASPEVERKASQSLPKTIAIERRPPALADYERLLRAVGWEELVNWDHTPQVLASAVAGTSAVDRRTGAVVGCSLLQGDGISFYYVRDVMVQPDYQGRGIGKALMGELMAWLEERAPERSMVGLFTGENLARFYERWGFRGPESLYGMTRRV
jgi:GNAT superfamily N-acetyltransferase/uncharacterized glyoxalase superfamily protein PhnB